MREHNKIIEMMGTVKHMEKELLDTEYTSYRKIIRKWKKDPKEYKYATNKVNKELEKKIPGVKILFSKNTVKYDMTKFDLERITWFSLFDHVETQIRLAVILNEHCYELHKGEEKFKKVKELIEWQKNYKATGEL